MKRKFGTFLFIIGGIMMILYIGTALANYPQIPYLLAGLGCLSVGILWMITGRSNEAAGPTGRFGILHKRRNKQNNEVGGDRP